LQNSDIDTSNAYCLFLLDTSSIKVSSKNSNQSSPPLTIHEDRILDFKLFLNTAIKEKI